MAAFNRTQRQGQLPGGQTAKARPGYRVQSLHKGHGRHAFHQSKRDHNDTQDECLSSCVQSRDCIRRRFKMTRVQAMLGCLQYVRAGAIRGKALYHF